MKTATLLWSFLLSLAPLALADSRTEKHDSVLQRDVCVIGGGASGTYAAIRLQQMGKSVALIEKQSRLGGHVNTYTDPSTGATLDYGVQIFSNTSTLRDFFSHFDIPLVALPTSGGSMQTVNFRTATPAEVNIYSPDGIGEALYAYAAHLAKYPGIAQRWDLARPVPEDLLLNFGDFLKKYNLNVMAPLAYEYNQGLGNILAQPTMYVMKYFDQQIVQDLINSAFVMNGLSNNQLLYDRAEAELGRNVFLSSRVTKVKRSKSGVEVHFETQAGRRIVHAKKLLLTIPPQVSNLDFLDLDRDQRQLFSQFNNTYYWDAVIRNSGIPDSVSLQNVDPAAAMNIPAAPMIYEISATGLPNTHSLHFSSAKYMCTEQARQEILKTVARLRTGLNFSTPINETTEVVEIHNHSPFQLTVSKQAVREGFYAKLQGLQGKRNTWWTGAAWNKHATAQLWNFTEVEILPKMLAEL